MEYERISIPFNLQTMLLKLDRLLPVYSCMNSQLSDQEAKGTDPWLL